MPKLFRLVYVALVLSVLPGAFGSKLLHAQSLSEHPAEQPYAFPRTWSLFAEYSPDSSPLILGIAQQRKFFTVGGAFTQRLFLKKYVGLSYMAEIRPLMLESDPVLKELITILSSPDGTTRFDEKFIPALPVINTNLRLVTDSITLNGATYSTTYQLFYSRRWTYVFGLSPIGFKINLLPHERIQPVLTALGGFAVSPRDIPVFDSSAFNFTFSFGGGVEFYRRPGRATRLEYRIQHLSNKYIGATNPGVDSQMVQASFAWGR